MLTDFGTHPADRVPKAELHAHLEGTIHPPALRMLAETIATDPTIDQEDRDMELALEAAEAAMEVSGGRAPDALATLALVQYHRGEVEAAIGSQKRAWMLARPRFKDEYKRVLRTYQGAAGRTSGLRGG